MSFKDFFVYKKAFGLAMAIFEVTKTFPNEEKYSLVDQIRRSSRSVCAQIAEAHRKKKYPRYYLSKLIDGDGENAETQVWLDFSLACQYLNKPDYEKLIKESESVGKLLNDMMSNPGKYGVKE